MSSEHSYRYIGRGLYSLSDAERLTKVPVQRIRRWMEGYWYIHGDKRRYSRPIVQSDIGRDAGELALTFADLMEIRFLNAFREKGVSWHSIRIAAERVGRLIQSTHPFSTKVFKTDGRTILAEIADADGERLLDLVRNQWEIHKFVSRFLFAGIRFNESNEPRLWQPETGLHVVLDPMRSFGAPIARESGVPTRILAAAAKAERSQQAAARMYDVGLRAVRDAVQFERRFAA